MRNNHKEIALKECDVLIETMKEWDDQKLIDIFLKLRDNARWDLMTDQEYSINNAKLATMFYEMQNRGIFGQRL